MELLADAMAVANLWSQWIWPLAQFVIGLGLVVFVHELGHFLVAKAVGIQVERFALGFGPRLFGVVLGETDYCVNVFPLGGYVKMLGQEDFRPLTESDQPDPRAYNAKSVSARMAVISAGVAMNVLFAALLFVIVALTGKKFLAPVVGGVTKHFPASKARITWHRAPGPTTRPVATVGLKPGDRITRIDGDSAILWVLGNDASSFERLLPLSTLADDDDTYLMTIQREVDGNTWTGLAEVGVRMGPGEVGGERFSFGIHPPIDTVVTKERGYTAAQALDPFEDGDRVVAINGRPIDSHHQIDPALRDHDGSPLRVTVRRKGKEVELRVPAMLQLKGSILYRKDGTKLDGDDFRVEKDKDSEDSLVLTSYVDGTRRTCKRQDVISGPRDLILDLLGMVPRIRITGIARNSGAAEAQLKPNDVVLGYGDRISPTVGELMEINAEVVGKGAHILIERDGKSLKPIRVVPRREDKVAVIGFLKHVDLAHPVVASVRPGSAAARVGIQPGMVVEQANDLPVHNWIDLFNALKTLQGQELTLTVRDSTQPDAARRTVALGELDKGTFDPDDYGYTMFGGVPAGFARLQVTLRQDSIGDALVWGGRETGSFILATYATLRGLVRQTVSTENIFGPLGMGHLAIQVGRRSFIDMIYFMALISATIGVLNFLPFPVMDGGHAVFLIIEKLRGKPVPVKVMNIAQVVGIAVLLLVFVAVTWQDIARMLS
jgi:regulator of sigma E protease